MNRRPLVNRTGIEPASSEPAGSPAKEGTRNVPTLVAGAISVLVVLALQAPMVFRNQAGSDYTEHAVVSRTLFLGIQFVPPHFLYFFLSWFLHHLVHQLSYLDAGRLVVLAFHALLAVAVFTYMTRSPAASGTRRVLVLAVLSGLAVQFVAPISVFTWPQHNLYLGYLEPGNVYTNPTIVVLKPLALLTFVSAEAVWVTSGRLSLRQVLSSADLSVLNTLAKPSYAICLLPALAITAAVRLVRRRPVGWGFLVAGFLIPLTITLAFQFVLRYVQPSKATGGITFAPFVVFIEGSRALGRGSVATYPWLVAKFFLSVLLPASVAAVYWRTFWRDPQHRLAWLTFGFGVVFAYFLVETGASELAGNFAWSGQITLFVLFVVSTGYWLSQVVTRFTWREAVCGVALLLHVLSGVAWYASQTSSNPVQWW